MLLYRRNSGQRGLLDCSSHKGEQNLPYDSQHDAYTYRSHCFDVYFLIEGKCLLHTDFSIHIFWSIPRALKKHDEGCSCLLLQYTTELFARHNFIQILSWKIPVKMPQLSRTTGDTPDLCKVVHLKMTVRHAKCVGYDRCCFKSGLTGHFALLFLYHFWYSGIRLYKQKWHKRWRLFLRTD